MENPQHLTAPVARQVFLQSFNLSQGDPLLQHYLLRYAAAARPDWRLDEECCNTLRQLTSTVHALAGRGVHFAFTKPGEVERELEDMTELMRTEFERPRADRSELLISIIRNTVFRDWRFLCHLGRRPRQANIFSSSSKRDPYLSFFCYYVLLENKTGVSVFDELLADMRHAVVSRSAIYEAAMDFPSINLCLSQVIACHNEKHPERQVGYIVPANEACVLEQEAVL
jgi:hypothetical protein